MGEIFLNKDEHLSKYLENPDMPNICPACGHNIHPKSLLISDKEYNPETHISICEVIFKCANLKCNSLFIVQYECFGTHSCSFATIPKLISNVEYIEDIEEISPDFYKIYNQASQAEQYGLESICGVGYRKAIEFLVKDYLKSLDTDKFTHEQVEKTALRNCIKQWIDDPRIKAMLERATVLGNDETHYRRNYLDKDLNDLKMLIQLTLHFINMELTYKKIEKTFPL